MNFIKRTVVLFVVCFSAWGAEAGVPLPDSVGIAITGVDVLAGAAPGWTTASDVTMDLSKAKMDYEAGAGILLHKGSPDDAPVALAATVSGDIELELDFMVSAGSDPVLYVLGRYPITLAGDTPGSVGMAPHAGDPLFRVRTPTVNVAKAPGLWQHLKIRYRATGASGKSADGPRFETVYLNGVLIHQQLYPDTAADNTAVAPLLSFLCREGHVAFRDIHYRNLEPLNASTDTARPRRFRGATNPIILNPGAKPYLLRSFLRYGGTKKTHAISVGNPNHSNFSYDLKQGALLQVWRGEFMDVTGMWEARGEPQTATPLGAVVALTEKPTLAVLSGDDARWPDTIAFDEMHNKGYTVDAAGVPTFTYGFSDMQVNDEIAYGVGGNSLVRRLDITGAVDGAHCLLAAGKEIRKLDKDLYAVNDLSYYVRIDKRLGAFIRKTPDGDELIVPVRKNEGHVSYSLIW